MTDLYKDKRLRVFITQLLHGRKDLVDDMIGDCLIVLLRKYDIDKLSNDNVLVYVVGSIAKLKSHRFSKDYDRQVFTGDVNTDESFIKSIDEFADKVEMTQLEVILLDAVATDHIKAISKESGVSYRCLRNHVSSLKDRYINYKKEGYDSIRIK